MKLDLSDMPEGTLVQIETHAVEGQNPSDTDIVVYNTRMNTVAVNEDSGDGLFSLVLSGGFNSDVYYIAVYCNSGLYGKGREGYYSIDVKTVTFESDEYESDDTIEETINTLSPGDDPELHTFHSATDVDYIKLECPGAVEGDLIKIETNWERTQFYGIWMDVYLYDSEGNFIRPYATTTSQTVGDSFIWEYTPGDYYIKVKTDSGGTGAYYIDVCNIQEPDEYEDMFDDAIGTTTNIIAPGDPLQYHTFHAEDGDYDLVNDDDYIILDCSDVSPGATLKIETYFWKTYSNTMLSLYSDVDQHTIDYIYKDLDGGDWSYARMNWVCETPGIYYILVEHTNYYSGDYAIDVQVVE